MLKKPLTLLAGLFILNFHWVNAGAILTQTLPRDGATSWGEVISGEVRAQDGTLLSHASAVLDGVEVQSDEFGNFEIAARSSSSPILIKKPGYRKLLIEPQSGKLEIKLEPVAIKSLYMQSGMVKNNYKTYTRALELLELTELNALTIDYKDDEGRVTQDIKPFIDELRARGVYTIARIVSFKDNQAPREQPELGIPNTSGELWKDKNGVTYLNPFNPKSWDYLIQLSKNAINDGFDEIQYDYVRFPTDGNLGTMNLGEDFKKAKKAEKSTLRTGAIAGFLKKAREEIGPMGGFVAADVFGITAYDEDDSGIGQQLETIAPFLDYACPMVYPSGFANPTVNIKNPVANHGTIVEDSVKRYRTRAPVQTVVRPWLQAFRDYAYDKRHYGDEEIRCQIDGSDKAGGCGFLLWNAGSNYDEDGLDPEVEPVAVTVTP